MSKRRKHVVNVGEPWPGELHETTPPRQWKPIYILILLAICAVAMHVILGYGIWQGDTEIVREILNIVETILFAVLGYLFGRRSGGPDP